MGVSLFISKYSVFAIPVRLLFACFPSLYPMSFIFSIFIWVEKEKATDGPRLLLFP